MEKIICDDCEKEAAAKIHNRHYCAPCAMRILQKETQRDGQRLGIQRQPRYSMSQRGHR